MDIRRVVRGLGRTLIAAGVLILLFVAYQLWGTGLAEARHQRQLTRQFERSLLEAPATTTTTATTAPAATPSPSDPPTTPATLPAGPPPTPEGDAVALIRIPSIGVDKAVVEGVSLAALKRGPGHYPGTPLPGQPGNAAIAGHRTTYGAPFSRLDQLGPGDPILVTTRQGRFRYEVSSTRVVQPSETSVLDPTGDDRLTLTTCEPKFSAARRLVVVADLVGEAAEPPPAPPPVATTTPEAPGPPATPATGPATPAPRSLAEAEEAGLSGESASNGPAVAWGAAAAAVWLLTWLGGRRWRRWPAYLVGAPVFFVVLFVFFENLNRLLPANY
ncbi:MAG: class E sortase [Acidimicrobiia bacterium]